MIGSIVDGAEVIAIGRPELPALRGAAYLARRLDGTLVVGIRALAWPLHAWTTYGRVDYAPAAADAAWRHFVALCRTDSQYKATPGVTR